MASPNIQIMFFGVFLGGKKWVSEKIKIIIEIQQIFKIPINGVKIIPILKKCQNTIFENFIPS